MTPSASVTAEEIVANKAIHADPPAGGSDLIERSMRFSTTEGSITTVFAVWTSGAVLTGYLLWLGAGPMELALLGSLPFLAQIVAPLAVWIQSIWPRRRALTVLCAALGRLVWALAVIAPFLFADHKHAVFFVLAIVAFSGVMNSFCGIFWTNWMADLVPVERRGRYFGMRNGICAVAGVAAQLIGGVLLDAMDAPHKYQLMMSLGVVFAAVGVSMLAQQYDPPMERPKRFSLIGVFKAALGDRNFRRFMIFVLYWQAAVLIGAPFVFPYFLDYLGLSFTTIALWATMAATLTLAFGPLWGKLADRVGNKPILKVTTIIAGTLVPLCWMMATPENHTMIWVSAFFEAVAWSAINPAIFNLTLATASKGDRMSYLSVLAVLGGAAGFLGALIAGAMLEGMKDWQGSLFGYTWTGYHTLFLVSGLGRSFAFLLLARVQETNAWSTLSMLRELRRFRVTGFLWRSG